VQWNYVKFLVDRNGHPVKRFPSLYDPADFEDDVRTSLPHLSPTQPFMQNSLRCRVFCGTHAAHACSLHAVHAGRPAADMRLM
jgi:hypothetical protein